MADVVKECVDSVCQAVKNRERGSKRKFGIVVKKEVSVKPVVKTEKVELPKRSCGRFT